ncbi:MAG: hypothetical protein KJN89_10185 [Gammaproteobacteria bacterium]|nr:hypothetical protein [Gammaproteobacteria bacterium]NNJ50733.1 hypothetical protein [Gammaproteobacteria bacterium]
MMYEITHTRQTNRSYNKRWFSSREMDLFVWSRGGVPIRFQLAYDKLSNEKAINWDQHQGFHHYLVDSGEILPDQYKQTPVLNPVCDQHDIVIIAREFLAACEQIDVGLSDFIYARLMEQLLEHVKNNARHTDHPPL